MCVQVVGRKQLRQETAALKSQLSSNTESLDGILASEGDRHRRYRAAVVRQRSQEARRELVASREGQTEHTVALCVHIYIWCIHTWHTQQKRKSMDRIQVALAPRMDLIWLSRACLG